MTGNCPKGLKKVRGPLKAVWIAACLFIGFGIAKIAAEWPFLFYDGPRPMAEIPMVIDESVRRNFLSTLITVFLFLKLGIPLLNPHRWWKKHWPIASFSIPFIVGIFVDSFCNSLWPGAGWSSTDPVLECFITGWLFGLSCLLTATIFHKSLPMASEPSSRDRGDQTGLNKR